MAIKNFKTIIITGNTLSFIGSHPQIVNTFSVPIFLQFVPTHFIIREVCYMLTNSAASVKRVVLLKTSLLNNESIFAFTRSGTSGTVTRDDISVELKYKMNPSTIKGNYDFTVVDLSGAPPDALLNMQIALTIEFVEEI